MKKATESLYLFFYINTNSKLKKQKQKEAISFKSIKNRIAKQYDKLCLFITLPFLSESVVRMLYCCIKYELNLFLIIIIIPFTSMYQGNVFWY